ncbi:hypothetical protein OIU76_012092 [Salix suchowensis]|nr:hypothetical protein OIU76_012092 [Salix suchowensis]
MAATGRLMVDSFATRFYKRMHFNRSKPVNTADEEKVAEKHEGRTCSYACHALPCPWFRLPRGRFDPVGIDSPENRIASIGAGDCSSFSNYWNLSGCFVKSKNNKAKSLWGLGYVFNDLAFIVLDSTKHPQRFQIITE